MRGAELRGQVRTLGLLPAAIHRQHHAAEARQRQQRHQVFGGISQSDANDLSAPYATRRQMMRGAVDHAVQRGEVEVARAVGQRQLVRPGAGVQAEHRVQRHSL